MKTNMQSFKEYESCMLCPRRCAVNRNKSKTGVCKESSVLRLGRASLHFWEEPCISGREGSGTVFFSGCPLKCIYCQNSELSCGSGVEITADRLCEIFFELEGKGANNINLVTPEHFAPHIAYALETAKLKGLKIPVVCNSGGYMSNTVLELFDGLIDIYMPDFKYISPELAERFSRAKDYPDIAKTAIAEMVRQTGEVRFNEHGMMQKGVLVRHLCLPSHISESKRVVKYLHDTYGEKIYISIMSQYTPVKSFEGYTELNRRITKKEYERIVDYAIGLGVENAFVQEGESAADSFIPSFNGEGIKREM